MFARSWLLVRDCVQAFVDDGAISRGASIAFYTITSLGPVVLVVIAVAGLAFGEDVARGAVFSELSGLMGTASADLVQTAVQSAATRSSGTVASIIGAFTLLAAVSGVFGEMQSALNAIWKAPPRGTTISRHARTTSLGLVAALGFLMLVSLVISALLSARFPMSST